MATHAEVLGARSVVREEAAAIPWTLWCMAAACTSAIIGAHWDISWHSSIGRDNFWTPAHIAIYLCGLFGGVSAGWLVFRHTVLERDSRERGAVSIFGLRAPLGAFLVGWGGVAMLTSAPFDDWWHNAYGLDVKIISPPHVLLIFGFFTVQIGSLLLARAERNQAPERMRAALDWLFLYLGGTVLITVTILLLEVTTRTLMHSALFYRTVCLGVPLVLALVSRASGHRWAATISAAVYTVFLLGFVWILPLFPAEPKLGPVYNPVKFFVPPQFPLLLIVPALVCDWLWQRTAKLSLWVQAGVGAVGFLVAFLAVQYPFADFLMSAGAKNWFFGGDYFGYYVHPNSYLRRGLFYVPEKTAVEFVTVMAQGLGAAIVLSRLGLGFGDWMRRVTR